MKQLKSLTELTVAELWKEVKVSEEEIWGDLKLEAQLFLKRILEGAMEDEVMEYIGISRKYERTAGRLAGEIISVERFRSSSALGVYLGVSGIKERKNKAGRVAILSISFKRS